MIKPQNNITSPCIGICAVNEDNICLGCYRNLDEISDWLNFDDTKRAEILTHCYERKLEK